MLDIKTANVTVMVKEMDRAIDFYVDGLGLRLKRRWGSHYAQVEAPGVIIGLHPTDQIIRQDGNISIGFGVSDLESARKTLTELGATHQVSDGKAGTIISFTDPDGTPLYIMKGGDADW